MFGLLFPVLYISCPLSVVFYVYLTVLTVMYMLELVPGLKSN